MSHALLDKKNNTWRYFNKNKLQLDNLAVADTEHTTYAANLAVTTNALIICNGVIVNPPDTLNITTATVADNTQEPHQQHAPCHYRATLLEDNTTLEIIYILATPTTASMAYPLLDLAIPLGYTVTLIEQYICANSHEVLSLSYPKININVADKAKLNHFIIHNNNQRCYQVVEHNISLAMRSKYFGYVISASSYRLRHQMVVTLMAEHAEYNLFVLMLCQRQENHDIDITVQHNSADGKSCIEARSLIAAQACGAVTGRLWVKPDSYNNVTKFLHKNILLAPSAVAHSRPELEIYNDNVQASHGSTIGHLDSNALFYLQSRGLCLVNASKLLIQGFINTVLPQHSQLSDTFVQISDRALTKLMSEERTIE